MAAAARLAALCVATWAVQVAYAIFLLTGVGGRSTAQTILPLALVASLAVACTAEALRPLVVRVEFCEAASRTVSLGQLVVWPLASYSVGVLDVYVVAFFATWVPLTFVDALDRVGLVTGQKVQELVFVRSASTFYACVRSGSAALQRALGSGARFARFAPAALANAETAGMAALDARTYAFRRHQVGFFVYATVKSAVFLCLPALEDAILDAIRSRGGASV